MANFALANSTTPAGTAQVATGSSYTFMLTVAAGISSNYLVPGSATSGLRRGKLYDILVGTNGAAADNVVEYEVSRSLVGTLVAFTGSVSSVSSAYMLDQADSPTGALLIMNGSAGSSGVVGRVAAAWYVGVNQRASYRWVAAPGSEIVYPAVSSGAGNVNGLSLNSRSALYTGNTTGTIMVSEM